eukprot:8921685-Heterocapsa_arctica.AAC.1
MSSPQRSGSARMSRGQRVAWSWASRTSSSGLGSSPASTATSRSARPRRATGSVLCRRRRRTTCGAPTWLMSSEGRRSRSPRKGP